MDDIGLVVGSFVEVNLSIPPRNGHIVVAIVNQEYTVKRLQMREGQIELHVENKNYAPVIFAEQNGLTI